MLSLNAGPVAATNACLMETNDDGTLTPILELDEQYHPGNTQVFLSFPGHFITNVISPAYYAYGETNRPVEGQLESFLAGRLYVEVDYTDGKFIGSFQPDPANLPAPSVGINVEPPFVLDNTDFSDFTVVATNNREAKVTLYGYGWDAFYLPLQFAWLEGNELLASTAVTTKILPVGTHHISLAVDDGFGTGLGTVDVKVITPGEAVESLAARLNQDFPAGPFFSADPPTQRLEGLLKLAADAFNQGNFVVGKNHLRAFARQIRPRFGAGNNAEVVRLSIAAEEITDGIDPLPGSPPIILFPTQFPLLPPEAAN